METKTEWYQVANVDEIDSPALLVYKERVADNIQALIKSIDDLARLRPHVKTNKSAEVATMMLNAGIKKFKCATIAEAEMLANVKAPDVLLAYQPIGPKIRRLLELVDDFPTTRFACLIDNYTAASAISDTFQQSNLKIDVYIDLNVGMNRTGVAIQEALSLYQQCASLKGISIVGLHAYDGHIRDEDFEERKKKCDEAFQKVEQLQQKISRQNNADLTIIAGGTPSYSIHSKRPKIECSPGTFIYWDKGYGAILKEQPFKFAALVLTRVISKPAEDLICLDLGHKGIASENSLDKRVYFLGDDELSPVSHSEEHLVCKTGKTKYEVGDVLYGVPHHICPTVALYDAAHVIEKHQFVDQWFATSRNRKITI